jgi:predicted nucleic acid-binding protein
LDSNIVVYVAVGAGKDEPKRTIEQSERFAISYWDAAILAAAEALGTDTVYTEDLSHGQRYGRVRVVNPFA